MKIELDGDAIRLDNKVVAFVRQNASFNDITRLREVFERANSVGPSGEVRKQIAELYQDIQSKLSSIIDEIGDIT